jgi:hypothetical protein
MGIGSNTEIGEYRRGVWGRRGDNRFEGYDAMTGESSRFQTVRHGRDFDLLSLCPLSGISRS